MRKYYVLWVFVIICVNNIYAQKLNEIYFIQSTVGDKYLDVINANPERLASIHVWKFTGLDSQKFTLKDAGEGYFYIVSNTRDKRALHVEDHNKDSKAKISLWEIEDKDNFKWKFIRVDDHYYIQSKLGTYLDLQRFEDINGTPIWMWKIKGNKGQKWKLKLLKAKE